MGTAYTIRKARMQDVRGIHALLMDCAGRQELLPRSLNDLYGHLRDFMVLVDARGDTVLGCCAFAICWEGLGEIRSLAVSAEMQHGGWGRRLVEACLSEAVMLGLYRVFTLTYVPGFFREVGLRPDLQGRAAAEGLGRLPELSQVPGLRRSRHDP